MANELILNYTAGATLYALLFDATGQIYNGATFEAPGSANWTNYDIALSEAATATGIYRGSMPAVAAGAYSYVVRKQAGGTPAVSDVVVGVGSLQWSGTAEVAQSGDAYARLGAPVALDGGAATVAGMLTKLADDNGGATFDATYDSLNKIKASVTAGVATALQAGSNTETTGTLVSGTYASTYLSNGVYWILAPVTPAVAESGTQLSPFGLNAYLKFTAATGQYVNSVTIRGYYNVATGASRYCNVYAYNYVTAAWDMLSDSTTRMNHATSNQLYTYTLLSAHQKPDAGGDGVGAIRIGFKSPSVTTGDRLNIDQCLVNVATAGASAADIAEAVKQKMLVVFYEGGVWIDTNAGTAGTVLGLNGTPANPVSNYADALVIAANLGVKRFYLRPDSSIQLTQSHAYWRFIGKGLIDLNGQAIDDAIFEDSEQISGASTGSDATFIQCQIRTCTLGAAYFDRCGFDGKLTLVASSNYTMHNCYDANPSTATQPIIEFKGSNNVGLRNWTGGVELEDMAATDYITADGAGRIIIGSTCNANPCGTITIRGPWAACTDNVAGGFKGTISDTQRLGEDQNVTNVTGSVTGKSPATLAPADVSGNLPVDLQTIKTQAVTAAAPVTFPGSIGTSTYAGADTAGTTELLTRIPDASPGAAGGLPTVDANNYVAGIQGTLNQLDDLNNAAAGPDAATIAGAVLDEAKGVHTGHIASIPTNPYTGTPPSAADIKTALEADGSKLDHLWETTEDDGGVRRFTANALEEGPTASGLTSQEVRDAMKLAPTAGAPALGSVDAHLDDILEDTGTTLPGALALEAGIEGHVSTALASYDAAKASDVPAAQDIRDAMKLAPSAGAPAADSVDAHLDDILEDTDTTLPALIGAILPYGVGTETVMIVSTDNAAAPLADVAVWVTTDAAGNNRVPTTGTLYSNALGSVTFYLDPGTYYVWRQGGNVPWVNPQTITVVNV
jgi:hypothetical protein